MTNTSGNLPKSFVQLLSRSSVNLVGLDENKLPKLATGSGCLIEHEGKKYLLTVTHNLNAGRDALHLALRWDEKARKTICLPVGQNLISVTAGKLSTAMKTVEEIEAAIKDVDFAYCEYPYNEIPLLQKLDESGSGVVSKSEQCIVFPSKAIKRPVPGSIYGFAGHTKTSVEDHPLIAQDVQLRFTEFRVAQGLTYIGEENGRYVFELPAGHPMDDKCFKGCSGAPIIDAEENIVALVSQGCLPLSRVYGVTLDQHMGMIKLNSQLKELGVI